jgi:hypothetical protein
MVAMFSCKPVFDRLFVQKASHVLDLPARAVTYDLPISFGDLHGFEDDMRMDHPPNMHPGWLVFQPGTRHITPWPRPLGSFGIPSWTGNEPISRHPSRVPILDGLATHGAFKAADLARLYNVLAAIINRAALTGSMTGF